MTQAVAYYRSSTELQEDSVSNQEFYAMKYCTEKMILIDKEIRDEFVSAKLTPLKQRNFSQILDGIKKGEINTLIVYKRDRLARDVVEYMEIYSVLKKYKVQVHFSASNEAPMRYDETGEFYELIMAGLCQHEGDQIKFRISEGRVSSFKQGKTKGNLPYGYLVNKNSGEIEMHPDALQDIICLFTEILSEKYSDLNELRLFLIDNKIQRKRLKEQNKFNPEWKVKAIEDLISNPMYMGIRTMKFKGEPVNYTDKKYAIIPVHDWYKAQEILEIMKKKNTKSKRPPGSFLLEQTIKCGLCKRPLTPIMRLRMKNWVGVYECKEHRINLLSDEIESEIFDICCNYFTTILTKDGELLFRRFFDKRVNDLKQKINRLDYVIHRLNGLVVNGVRRYLELNNVMEKSRVKDRLVSRELKLKEVRDKKDKIIFMMEKLRSLPKQINSFHNKSEFTDALKRLELGERKELLADIIVKAEIHSEGMDLIFKHPYPNTIGEVTNEVDP